MYSEIESLASHTNTCNYSPTRTHAPKYTLPSIAQHMHFETSKLF